MVAAGNLDTGLRRRMLIGFLGLLSLIYAVGAAQSYLIDTPRTDGRGELLATVLTLTGLVCALPTGSSRWRYALSVICVCLAPSASLVFHHYVAAQTWSVVPLVCAAVFVRTWHPPAVARAAAVLIWLAASVCLLIAPAPVPILWLAFFGASILGAAEVFGAATSALLEAALRDPLTSVWNRAGIDIHSRRILAQARRRGESVAVIILDFDDFKTVNDRDGHAAGDAALGDFADGVLGRLPESAVLGRLGGDEFVVILSDCELSTAHQLARSLSDGHLVAVSYGVAAGHPDAESLAGHFDAADADLYRRKRSRKDVTPASSPAGTRHRRTSTRNAPSS